MLIIACYLLIMLIRSRYQRFNKRFALRLRAAVRVVVSDQRPKSVLEFIGSNKGTDHAAIVVGRSVVKYVEPKSEAIRIWISAQIAKVLG